MTLAEIEAERKCRILAAAADDAQLQGRLYALGLYPGAQVHVLRKAPFGDPLQLKVGQSLLSIRLREAKQVQVEAE